MKHDYALLFVRQEGMKGLTDFKTIGLTVDSAAQLPDVEVLLLLKRAVTDWAANHATGREAWQASGEDYNIGDLVTDLADESLVRCLAARGISHVRELTTGCKAFDYDAVLMDERRISEEVA